MKINLTEIYKGLDKWRAERGITAESQKAGYLVNVMEEFGELAQALRDYEKIKNGERVIRAGTFDIKSTLGEMIIFEGTTKGELEISLEKVEHEIIDAICDICVFTINAEADIPYSLIPFIIETKREFSVADIFVAIADFIRADNNGAPFNYYDFALILKYCASVSEHYGFNFEIAMLETIKEISSRTGTYDEKAKKWVKDESDEAKAKWYKADYEKARIKNE